MTEPILVLDLDDTVYLERDYVHSGFAAVASMLEARYGATRFFDVAWSRFESGLRGTIFDAALAECDIPADAKSVAEMVDIYRHHIPNISPCPDVVDFLRDYPRSRPLALITDGPVPSQTAKVKALGLESRFDLLIYSDAWGTAFRKPHERPYLAIEERWPSRHGTRYTYVADNPLKDFLTPKARGWATIRIARPGGEHSHRTMVGAYAADQKIASFEELRTSYCD